MSDISKYTRIAYKLRQDPTSVSDADVKFFVQFTPEIDEDSLQEIKDELDKLKEKGEPVPPELSAKALLMSTKQLLSSPDFKDRTLKIAQDAEKDKNFNKIAEGFNLLLAGTDVINSINQIAQSQQMAAENVKPASPATPQRDQYLQRALRKAEEGNFGVSQTLAPAQAEIADQYRADLQNAKTASTGQAGAFGSYAQLAANRRNRAALGLAPIANEVRMQNQAMYNDLLGKRQQETQNMFENSMATYPYDLQQYQIDQQAAANLNRVGNENLRRSLSQFGTSVADPIAEMMAKRRYDRIRNGFSAYGDDIAKSAAATEMKLDKNVGYKPSTNQFGPTRYYNDPYQFDMMQGLY